MVSQEKNSFLVNLLSGGCAGTSVDVALFPLDTIKTRLQSSEGFVKAGGFRGIYRGLSAAAAGSAPGAALFFSSYEASKEWGTKTFDEKYAPLVHMGSASVGETVACLVRVPTEVVKQRMQTGQYGSFREAVSTIMKTEGPGGFYTGYLTTVAREIPFSFIQFPMYEGLKKYWSEWQGKEVGPSQSALCGSISGGIAAGITTPLDVVKTRLMLGQADLHGVKYEGMLSTLQKIYVQEGMPKLFAGFSPRVTWISIGGFVFFGSYEAAKSVFSRYVS
uniref:S-adenosylmethionine mitochondrial carrier protein n=1 Tax=Fibrocapsa japonica TaxID=94617 RepID=A0A7S2Y3T2_9STRA|mmetsp:Transcript_6083/g.9221  ORF Transcript_6083/g.9221 Transcript_6083/m.9221 type:complete len:276 (+) Transcript_6083:71-898(+)